MSCWFPGRSQKSGAWSLKLGAWSLRVGLGAWRCFLKIFLIFHQKKNALFFYAKKKCYELLLELASRSSRLIRKVQASSSAPIFKIQDRLGFYGSVLHGKKLKKKCKKKMTKNNEKNL
jgi:hypothetical protein